MKIIYCFDGINVIYEINIGSPNLNLLSTDIRCEHLTPPPFFCNRNKPVFKFDYLIF